MKISVLGQISQSEIDGIIREEKERYVLKGKELAEISIIEISSEELEIRSRAKSNIKRVRRITGYLSTLDRFNDSKQAELSDRVIHS